ncbi:MAG: tripartite tricarboxylate transporter TctB family protein [bacterium]|nr:tripartite tricarboxylate transporter TctB family protein [bacterium]
MPASRSAPADVAAGLALGVLSLAFLVGALRMPMHTMHWTWLNAPGLVPTVLAAVLLAQALALTLRGLRHLRARSGDVELVDRALRWGAGRVVLTLVLALAFAFLMGRMPFAILTALFVFTMTMAFRGTSAWKAVASALITAATVTWVFTRVFLVPLP